MVETSLTDMHVFCKYQVSVQVNILRGKRKVVSLISIIRSRRHVHVGFEQVYYIFNI
jgi:hypothetical protein